MINFKSESFMSFLATKSYSDLSISNTHFKMLTLLHKFLVISFSFLK